MVFMSLVKKVIICYNLRIQYSNFFFSFRLYVIFLCFLFMSMSLVTFAATHTNPVFPEVIIM